MIQKSKFLCVTVVVFLCLITLVTFSFAKKESKQTLDALAIVAPELRVVETTEDYWGITDDYASKAGIVKFLSENNGSWSVFVDARRGVPSLVDGGAIPFIPGPANSLSFRDFGATCESMSCIPREKVEELAREFLNKYPELFPLKQGELVVDPNGTFGVGNSIYLLRFQWVVDGIPVENGSIFFRINNGNLIQIASSGIAPIEIDTMPAITATTALDILNGYLGSEKLTEKKDEILDKGSLTIVPITPDGKDPDTYYGPAGTQAGYALCYRIMFKRDGVRGIWEGLVDAHSGKILRFVDSNRYGRIHGGIRPSDGLPPEEDRPFPYADTGLASPNNYSDGAGMFSGNNATSTLQGKYARINDSCGSISNTTTTGDLDFLTDNAAGTDCVVPSGNPAGPGNTHSSRTLFYNLTAINLKAQIYAPTNTWLTTSYMTANVNKDPYCNASSGGGVVNFYQHVEGSCNNLGEIPGIAMHEWAHGYDDEDGTSSQCPPVETYADWTAIIQTHNSCTGAGFLVGSNCDGYGDACTSCTGVRDCDYMKHAAQTPWTSANQGTSGIWDCGGGGSYNGPCGWEDHCESGISTQALWDFVYRDLPTECGVDLTTGWMLEDRLWFTGVATLTASYTCSSGTTNGCSGTVLYSVMRALDDDGDGTANGTPHAHAIYHALHRHLIDCNTYNDSSAENQNHTSCPTLTTPVLSSTSGNNSVNLSWTSGGASATRYFIYKNESGCDVAFNRIAIVNAPTLTYTDTTCANGVTYYYRIQAATNNDSCVSPTSNCINQTPQPCAGSVTLSKSVFNCNDSGTISVLDSTAPTSPFNVQIWSTTDSTPRDVSVSGTPSTYTGTFTTTTGTPGVNQVKVSNGDTIYVRYVDPDYCGTPNTNVDTNASVDCVGPVISNVQANVAGVTATITWTTNELSNSKVYYGTTPPTWSQGSDGVLVTSHSIVIPDLPTCTKLYFYVESTDSAGNTSSDNNGGSYYTFVTGLLVNLVQENFEGTWGPYGNNPPTGWTIEDHGDESPKQWNENDWYNYAKGGAYGAVARVNYSPVEDQDEWLITPAFDISSDLTSVNLEYDHYFRVYSSGEYGYVDYKSDQHPTWVNLSTYSATTADMAHVVTPLTSYIGDTNAQIRFRYVSNNGWNWDVDNVLVQASGTCASSMGSITLDKNIYICNSDTITITIRDTDLSGSAQATVTTTGGDSETVTCNETGVGVFTGTILTGGLPIVTGNGVVNVTNGETITATYYDANDGSGNPATVNDTAITDCVGPVISNVMATNITGSSATITWTTDENSNSRVTYGTSIPPSTNQDDLTNYTTSHTINLSGLTPCTPYYFSVTSSDSFGNSTTDTNGGSYYNFATPNTDRAIFSEDFSTVTVGTLPAGWTESHSSGNAWSTSASGCTNNALYYPYTYSSAANSWVYTPAIALTSGVTYSLHFNQKVASATYPEKFEVTCGSSAAPSGQTITVLPSATYTNTTCQPLAPTFSVPTSGNYYIAWHCTSDAGMDYLYIDDVNLTKPGSCTADLEYQSKVVTDVCSGTGSGGGNGIVEPGEDATIQVTMINYGGSATGVSATLTSTTPGVTVTQSTANFPDIGASGTGTSISPFSVHISSSVTCVTVANFTLHSTSNENPTGNDSYFTINIGQAGGVQSLFSENFNSVTTPSLPVGWTESHSSGNAWQTASGGCSGNALEYPYNSGAAANSWVFTPAIALTSGVTYTLNFNQKVASGTYAEKFEVKCGSSATPAGQTITILPSATYTNTTCQPLAPTFSVPTSGNYYISWHCTSDADKWNLYIDDVNLTKPTSPICNVCIVGPNILFDSYSNLTQVTGNGDAYYDKGEKWSVRVTLKNTGTSTGTNIFATLSGNGITVCTPTKSFGNIAVGGTGYADFEFVIDSNFSPCGGAINFNVTNKACTEQTPAGPNESNLFNINVGKMITPPSTEIVIQPSSADTYVNQNAPTNNYGTATTMMTNVRTNREADVLVQFSLSSIPAGSVINSATLELYNTTAPASTYAVDVNRNTSTWTESAVTWNTKPTYATPYIAQITPTTAVGWKIWTVTSAVQGWYDGTYTNYGFTVRPDATSGSTNVIYTFASKENGTVANRPILRVNYSPAPYYDCSYVGGGMCQQTCNMTVDVTPNGTTTVCTGQDIVFTATPTNGTAPYTYQWTENGSPVGTNSNTYTANKSTAGSYTYNCKVTDSSGLCNNITDATDSTGVWNQTPGTPTISSVTDKDACALSGVTITWATVTGATSYDIAVNSTSNVVGNTASTSYDYSPSDSNAHNYYVRAKNASCTGLWSTGVSGTDVNGTPSQPVITSIVDIDPNNLTGIQVYYTSGTPATRHDLYKDGSLAASSYVSGATYQPGDNSTHSYVVKAINGTCTIDSAAVNGTDAYTVTPPPEPTPVNPSTDKSTLSWSPSAGATGYRVYKGTKTQLPALCDATADFCTAQDNASLSYSLTGDTPNDTYKCFYYLVTAHNAGGESSAGTATCGARTVNTTGTCP